MQYFSRQTAPPPVFCSAHKNLIINIRPDHNELIAADAVDILLFDVLVENSANLLDHFVAHVMTERIVDPFQPIDVQKSYAYRKLLSAQMLQHLVIGQAVV